MPPLTREQQLLVDHSATQRIKKLQLIAADRTRATAILGKASKLLDTLTVTANPPPQSSIATPKGNSTYE